MRGFDNEMFETKKKNPILLTLKQRFNDLRFSFLIMHSNRLIRASDRRDKQTMCKYAF